MKRIFMAAVSLLLCFAILFATPAVSTVSANSEAVNAVSADSENDGIKRDFVDVFVNYMIDVIHRFLVVLRYPWQKRNAKAVDMSKF